MTYTGPVAVTTAAASDAARRISAYRAERGKGGLVVDATLNRMAAEYAEALARAQTLSHSIGGEFPARLATFGVEARTAAENLGAGSRDVAGVLERWRASRGHDANLLMDGADRIGFAHARAPGSRFGDYWVLILAGG